MGNERTEIVKFNEVKEKSVRNEDHLLKIINHIQKKRIVKRTPLNENSSRGHVIINLTFGSEIFTFYDLAGR